LLKYWYCMVWPSCGTVGLIPWSMLNDERLTVRNRRGWREIPVEKSGVVLTLLRGLTGMGRWGRWCWGHSGDYSYTEISTQKLLSSQSYHLAQVFGYVLCLWKGLYITRAAKWMDSTPKWTRSLVTVCTFSISFPCRFSALYSKYSIAFQVKTNTGWKQILRLSVLIKNGFRTLEVLSFSWSFTSFAFQDSCWKGTKRLRKQRMIISSFLYSLTFASHIVLNVDSLRCFVWSSSSFSWSFATLFQLQDLQKQHFWSCCSQFRSGLNLGTSLTNLKTSMGYQCCRTNFSFWFELTLWVQMEPLSFHDLGFPVRIWKQFCNNWLQATVLCAFCPYHCSVTLFCICEDDCQQRGWTEKATSSS
jgi:hypothetical protein